MANAADVGAQLRRVEATTDTQILLDLTQLHYVDAAALHVMEERRDSKRVQLVGAEGLFDAPVVEDKP